VEPAGLGRPLLKRGELWTAAGGQPCTTKPRPVLIIQDDRFADTDSVTVCPLTSDPTKADLLRIALEPTSENGLQHRSCVVADKVSTIPRARLGTRLGRIDRACMTDVERAILVFLGFASPSR
jgi:mRNA interferase MazF